MLPDSKLVRKAKDVIKPLVPKWVFTKMKERALLNTREIYSKKTGTARACNICGATYSIFAPFHGGDDRMCVNCFSLERHRLLYDYLQQCPELIEGGKRILHFAPERCLHDYIASVPGVTYETADLLIQFLPIIEAEPKHKMSITDIEFPANSFDLFICNHVLEHVPDDRAAFKEIYRILKPGGVALLQVPLNPDSQNTLEDKSLDRHERMRQYGAQDHLRYYGADDFQRRCEQAGFSVSRYTKGKMPEDAKYRFDPNEVQFICTK